MLQRNYSVKTYITSELTNEEIQCLILLIKPLYLWYSPNSTLEKIQERLTRQFSTVIDVVFHRGYCCGFAVYYTVRKGKYLILFRDGVVLDQKETSKGIYSTLIQLALDRVSPDFMAMRTQNPRVYETMKKFSVNGKIYPSFTVLQPPKEVVKIAKSLCYREKFNFSTFVVKGVYGGDRFYASYHSCRDPEIMKGFKRVLETKDALLIIVPTRNYL